MIKLSNNPVRTPGESRELVVEVSIEREEVAVREERAGREGRAA